MIGFMGTMFPFLMILLAFGGIALFAHLFSSLKKEEDEMKKKRNV